MEEIRMKNSLKNMQSRKDEIRREFEQKLRDFKRKQDREFGHQKALVTEKVSDFIQEQQDQSKLMIQKQYDARFKRIED